MLRFASIKSTSKRLPLQYSAKRCLATLVLERNPSEEQNYASQYIHRAEHREQVRKLRDLMRKSLRETCYDLCMVGSKDKEKTEAELEKIETWTKALSDKLNQHHPFADIIEHCLKEDLSITPVLYQRYIRSEEFKRLAQNRNDPRPHLYAPYAKILVKQLKSKELSNTADLLKLTAEFLNEYNSFYLRSSSIIPLINYLAEKEDVNFLINLIGALDKGWNFATEIVSRLLYVDNMERIGELMQCILKSETDVRIFINRIKPLLIRKLKAIQSDSSTPAQVELRTISGIIASGFIKGEETSGHALSTIFGSSALNDDILKQIINYLMEDPNVLISKSEIVRIENQLRDANMPERAKLLSRLKSKNSSYARWMNTEDLGELVKEAKSLEQKGDVIKPEVLCSLYDVIMKKAINVVPIDLNVLTWVMPNFQALEKKINSTDLKNYRQMVNNVLSVATNYALLERKFEAFDQLWELRPFRSYQPDQITIFALSLFERGEKERTVSILNMLKDNATTIDEKTLSGVAVADYMRTIESEKTVEDFLRLLAEHFTISLEWHRRLIAAVQLNTLHKLIDDGKLAEVNEKIALMGEPVIKDPASSFVLIDLLKAAIKANNAQIFAKTKEFIEARRDRYTAVLYIGISFLELNDNRWPAMLNKISHIPTDILRQLIKRQKKAKQAEVLHSLFNVLNKPETSSIELETLLEETVILYCANNDLEGLKTFNEQVKNSSFYLNAKLKVKIESSIKKLENQFKEEDRILTPQPPTTKSSSSPENKQL